MKKYIFDQKNYRSNLKKKASSFFPIIIILIIILTGLVLFFKSDTNNLQTYHFVQIDGFSTYSSANECCEKLLKQNAKGFIHFDKEYRVLVSHYPTKKQARNVIENLIEKYPNAKIYSLSFQKFNGKNLLTRSQNNSIFNISDKIETMISDLYSLISSYEKNEISNKYYKSETTKLYEDYLEAKDSFFSNLSKPKFHNHRNYVDKILSSIKKIKDLSSEQNISKTSRFELMQIIFNYSKFCGLF